MVRRMSNEAASLLKYYRFERAALTIQEAAKIFSVTPRTWIAWETGRRPFKTAILRLIRLVGEGITQDGPWHGWRVHNGTLYSPEGDGFTPGDIRALPYLQALNAELKLQVRINGAGREGAPVRRGLRPQKTV